MSTWSIGYLIPDCSCNCGSPPPPPPPPPPATDGCGCGTGVVPAGLFFSYTSGGTPFGPYALTWQATPTFLLPGPAMGWYTNSAIVIPFTGGCTMDWYLHCLGPGSATWKITEVLNPCGATPGSLGADRDSWSTTLTGNTCSPFLLSNDNGSGAGSGIDSHSGLIHP